jgi:hypothetical protein
MPRTAVKKAKTTSRSKGKAEKDKKPASTALTLPDGTIIDLSTYDWEGERLTEAQKLFIIWFSTPGTEYYHKAMKAARKAGYTPKTANAVACKMRNDPKIKKFIDKIENTIGKANLVDAAQRWLQEKITRADYDIKDFYETTDYEDKNGVPHKKLMLKPLEELTPEQRLCIDGVDVKGMSGTMVYSLPDREKIRDSLIEFLRKQQIDNEDSNDEETMEIIMERLTVKKTMRKAKDEVSQVAGLLIPPRGEAITEL